jgi:hypothetical protein
MSHGTGIFFPHRDPALEKKEKEKKKRKRDECRLLLKTATSNNKDPNDLWTHIKRWNQPSNEQSVLPFLSVAVTP